MNRRTFLKASGAGAVTPLLSELLAPQLSEAQKSQSSKQALEAEPAAGDESNSLPHVGLAGTWRFQLDPNNEGEAQRWFERRLDAERIFLPGDTDQACYGKKTEGPADGRLSRPYIYVGPAWYQTEFTVPELWRGKCLSLFLERCHWQTSAWIDGKSYGTENSLCVPHVHDIGIGLEPGLHTLTLCVDNTVKINVGAAAHSITEQTQTNWNGVIGKTELRCAPPVWIENVRVFPDTAGKRARLEILLRNAAETPAQGKIEAALRGAGGSSRLGVSSFEGEKTVALTLAIPGPLHLWDEYEPSTYIVDIRIKAAVGELTFAHKYSACVGMRELTTKNGQFLLNGRAVFLRGTVENAVFPLTAYPPMDLEPWRRIFGIARSYGMNHLRFHSWCPPEAAFAAADEAGFLLHVELPVFSHHVSSTPGLEDFMRQEGQRILRTYNNHPSFAMLCMGNELKQGYHFLDGLVTEFKQSDSRHRYTYSTNNGRDTPGTVSQYWVTEETPKGRLRIDRTRFGATAGGTDYDFSQAIAGVEVPVVAHELGQWVVYPSYDEIDKYTGILKPRNLEVFRAQLAARGMIDQAEIFQAASGRFAAQIYKEEIESALRTPNFGGFQLLELTDYPGQHEALVGMLDCFWDSKHLITPAEFRNFCNRTVPLLRFAKFIWTSQETFRARAELAHYGKEHLRRVPVTWKAQDDRGRTIASGVLARCSGDPGGILPLGEIEFSLSRVHEAMRLTITLKIGDGIHSATNSWRIWVYPHRTLKTQDVLIAGALDSATLVHLQQGGTVLLSLPPKQESKYLLKLRFLPVFWSFAMFKKQPGVLGILCDPRHPALASFPTEMHSDWQWWELTQSTNAFILDETPHGFRPLIQVIDDFHRNHKLGLVFEAQVGKGKLLATSLALGENLEDRPVGRQLLSSLLDYVSSESFQPRASLSAEVLQRLLTSS